MSIFREVPVYCDRSQPTVPFLMNPVSSVISTPHRAETLTELSTVVVCRRAVGRGADDTGIPSVQGDIGVIGFRPRPSQTCGGTKDLEACHRLTEGLPIRRRQRIREATVTWFAVAPRDEMAAR